MASEFDLSRDVAEKLIKRVMAPFRDVINQFNPGPNMDWPQGISASLTLEQVRAIDTDLGALGLAMAVRYSEQVEYQIGLRVMAAENVRLHETIEVMAEMAQKYKDEVGKLASDLAKVQTVNSKLKHLTAVEEKPAFRSGSKM